MFFLNYFYSLNQKRYKNQIILFLFFFFCTSPLPALAALQKSDTLSEENYNYSEIVKSGHTFFQNLSGTFAKNIESIFSRFGSPSAYIIGEEAGAGFIFGVSYGEGKLHFKNKNEYTVFWQGPSFGFDAGAQGTRVMMLVYHLDDIDKFWARYGGFSGNAYLIAGMGITALYHKKVLIVPIRSGMGARLGVNFNYLKFTSAPTWNPF